MTSPTQTVTGGMLMMLVAVSALSAFYLTMQPTAEQKTSAVATPVASVQQ